MLHPPTSKGFQHERPHMKRFIGFPPAFNRVLLGNEGRLARAVPRIHWSDAKPKERILCARTVSTA